MQIDNCDAQIMKSTVVRTPHICILYTIVKPNDIKNQTIDTMTELNAKVREAKQTGREELLQHWEQVYLKIKQIK